MHECAIRHVAKYLVIMSTYVDLSDRNRQLSTCGVVYKPGIEKGIECYVDAGFANEWAQADFNNA